MRATIPAILLTKGRRFLQPLPPAQGLDKGSILGEHCLNFCFDEDGNFSMFRGGICCSLAADEVAAAQQESSFSIRATKGIGARCLLKQEASPAFLNDFSHRLEDGCDWILNDKIAYCRVH